MRIETTKTTEIKLESIEDCIEMLRLVEDWVESNEDVNDYYREGFNQTNWKDLENALNPVKRKLDKLVPNVHGIFD